MRIGSRLEEDIGGLGFASFEGASEETDVGEISTVLGGREDSETVFVMTDCRVGGFCCLGFFALGELTF